MISILSKRLYLFTAIALLVSARTFAQTQGGDEPASKGNGLSSGSVQMAASFVDQKTGRLNYGIPLPQVSGYTVSANAGLSYSWNGLKVGMKSSTVGMGYKCRWLSISIRPNSIYRSEIDSVIKLGNKPRRLARPGDGSA